MTANMTNGTLMKMGVALSAMTLVVAIGGGVWTFSSGALTSNATLTQQSHDFKDFETDMKSQLGQMNSQLQTLVTSLSGETAQITQMQDHLHALDVRSDSLDGRLRDVEGNTRADRADLDNIMRSDRVPLGPRK